MTYATIDDLRSQLGKPAPSSDVSSEYAEKMLHPLPQAETVDRVQFILERVKGRCVLEFGASGPMHEGIVKVASSVVGVDRETSEGVIGFDLDRVTGEPPLPEVAPRPELIVCGEVLEHLANPGWFLERLKRQYAGVPVILTTPNAFSAVARKQLGRGVENVNKDHVCWFSWKTLHVLVTRYGFTVNEFLWYGGPGPTAQGLIVVME